MDYGVPDQNVAVYGEDEPQYKGHYDAEGSNLAHASCFVREMGSGRSCSVREMGSGSNLFVVEGYSMAKDIGIGNYIVSDQFTMGGCKWILYLYPNGKTKWNSAFLSLLPVLKSEAGDIPGTFEFTLMDLSGNDNHSFEISKFKNVEKLDPRWTDPQAICSQNHVPAKGGLGPFGLLVLASKDIQEYTAVYLRVFRAKSRYIVLMCSDQSRSSLHLDYDKTTYGAFIDLDPAKERLYLRTLIDHSIVERFGGEGKACITARVYPSLAIDGEAHLYAFNNGTDNITPGSSNQLMLQR